jgi:hypothetical protein
MSIWAGISVFKTCFFLVRRAVRLDGPDHFCQAKALVRRLNVKYIVCVQVSDQRAKHYGLIGRSAGAIALKAE